MQTAADFAQFTVNGAPLQAICETPLPEYGPQTSLSAIYFHIPFCFHKCHYCDFYSIVEETEKSARRQDRGDRQKPFIDAILRELNHCGDRIALKPRTLFIGGGTPTLLRIELWRGLLSHLQKMGIREDVSEFTVEANPETVTPELAHLLASGGVNRISIGAQSFNLTHLKTLERWHDPSSVGRAVATFRDAGIANLNLDLIFAIPGQTLVDVAADLDAAIALQPDHLSCYSLIFEPNTAMTQRMKMGQVTPVDEELERDMYALVMEKLAAAGFEQYEISNWAKQSPNASHHRRCEHNLIYWHNENWLGIGPAAASHINGIRWKNEPHLGHYLNGSPTPPVVDVERLSPERSLGEQLMLLLRLNEGVSHEWLSRHLDGADSRQAILEELISVQMLERTATHTRLTCEGRFLADAVIGKLL